MPDELRWWFGNRDYYLREQSEELQASLAAAAGETSRLRSQLRSVQGSLEQRVNRLAAAFDAFAELSDLRSEMTAFAGAATARHRVRRLVLNGARGERTQPLADGLDDVPGYWLVPAAQAFAALARGNGDVAAGPLREAQARDRARTGLFLVSALGVIGSPAAATRWLADALGAIDDGGTTVATRALWRAAALGRYGGDGARLVAERLERVVAGLTGPHREEVAAAWVAAARGVAQSAPDRLPRTLDRDPSLRAPLAAAAALHGLRAYCEATLSPPEPGGEVAAGGAPGAPGPAGTDGATRTDGTARTDGATRTDGAASAGASAAEPSDAPPGAAGRNEADPLARLVVDLLEEGSPDEAPLLARVRELREVIESNGAAAGGSGRPRPDAPAGDTLELLRDDAFSAGEDPSVRAIALAAGAPLLLPAVDELVAEATTRPATDVEVAITGTTVRIGPAGGAGGDLQTLDARLAESYRSGHRPWIGYAAGGVGIVLILLGGLAGSTAAFVFGVLFLVAGVGYAIYALTSRRGAARELGSAQEDAHRRVTAVATDLGAYQQLRAEAATAAASDAEALRRLVAAVNDGGEVRSVAGTAVHDAPGSGAVSSP